MMIKSDSVEDLQSHSDERYLLFYVYKPTAKLLVYFKILRIIRTLEDVRIQIWFRFRDKFTAGLCVRWDEMILKSFHPILSHLVPCEYIHQISYYLIFFFIILLYNQVHKSFSLLFRRKKPHIIHCINTKY
jgi:hypothetical protein